MKVKSASIVASLHKLSRWIDKLPQSKRGHEATENRVEDIVVGCLDLLEYSPTLDVQGWLVRKTYRVRLNHPARAVWTKLGRRAIQELITLTISELEAARPFWPELEAGVLPIRKRRAISAAHRDALYQGRDQYHKQCQQRTATSERTTAEMLRLRSLRTMHRGVL